MRNKLVLLIILAIFSSCSKDKPEDPLILPPEFEIMPELNKDPNQKPKVSDQDIEELKDLLLQTQ